MINRIKRKIQTWLHGHPQYQGGQWVWYRHELGIDWWRGRISPNHGPTNPYRTHYNVWVEGDPMRSRVVAVDDLKPWEDAF